MAFVLPFLAIFIHVLCIVQLCFHKLLSPAADAFSRNFDVVISNNRVICPAKNRKNNKKIGHFHVFCRKLSEAVSKYRSLGGPRLYGEKCSE